MKKMKKYKKKNPNKLSMTIIFLIVVFFGVFSVMRTNSLKKANEEYLIREASLSRQIDEEKQKHEELKEKEEYVHSEEYIQGEAREKLGLVNENEIIFKEE